MNQYIGKMLDNRYEILDVIGVGGMAVVYKAYCHRLHRFVAIKILKRDLAADAEFRRRFHEEAQAVAMLSHPNIVSVYDVSRGDDMDYIVMELIDGITLKQYMQKKNGALNWRESLYFITQIVRALGHAHSRGIIHRDIKPQNIMVLRDGSVKVADFGIARIMSAAQNTLTQEALGSVHYISPEQARGSHIDARADIYSAGVVLYEMLTGRLPFDGDSPVSVAIQHISSVPLSPREINPEIPDALEAITMKAMASRIDQRYMNAEAMIRDLEEFRKNPQIDFHYDLDSFHGSQPVPDEPTQIMDTTGSLGRRTKTAARARRRPEPYPEERQIGEYKDRPERSERQRNLVVPIVIVVSLVGVGLFLWLVFFSGLFRNEPTIPVPNLVGQALSDVLKDSDVTDHFSVVQTSTAYSDKYEEGQIISQTPDVGKNVKGDGTTINVVVSSGQESITMIDLKDMSYDQAVSRVQEQGLKVDKPEYASSSDVKKGNVISFTPLTGTKVQVGDTVKMVVSTGPEIKKVTVPTLTGQSIDNARAMLKAANLNVASVVEVTSNEKVGQVVYQSISPSTEVEEGTSIALNVSKGPDTTTNNTVKTKTITIVLPTDRETVSVRVTVNNTVKYENVVNTATASTIHPTLDGTGIQNVCVYFDGVLQEQYDLDFNS